MTSQVVHLVKFHELLEILADLSLNGETFEIAHAALRLQTELVNTYGDKKNYD
jgi:hypothetical protein